LKLQIRTKGVPEPDSVGSASFRLQDPDPKLILHLLQLQLVNLFIKSGTLPNYNFSDIILDGWVRIRSKLDQIRNLVTNNLIRNRLPVSVHDIKEVCEGNPAHLLLHVGLELHYGGGHAQRPHDHRQLVQGRHAPGPIQ
jgi:hypothetical protein